MLSLFRRAAAEGVDQEYMSRCERLRSELQQSRQVGSLEGANTLLQDLNTIEKTYPTAVDLVSLIKIEAELCMIKPTSLLYPTYLRLKSRLYRFEPAHRASWENDLKRLLPDDTQILQEDVLRQKLRHLTYELNEAAEAYNRLSKERTDIARRLTMTSVFVILMLGVLVVTLVKGLSPGGPLLFDGLIIISCLTRLSRGYYECRCVHC